MSNEISETFIGVNRGWALARCRHITYCGDEPVSSHGCLASKRAIYAVGNSLTEMLVCSAGDIADANQLYRKLSDGEWKKTTLSLVNLTERQAFRFMLDMYDLNYLSRLGYRAITLGRWALVLKHV